MKRVILLLISLSIYGFCFAQSPATLAGIRYQVRVDVRNSMGNNNFELTTADLNAKINQAQDYVVRNTKCLYNTNVTTPVANQQEYLLPDDCEAVDRVAFTGSGIPRLKGRTVAGLDNEIASWQKTSAGTPMYYYRRKNYVGLYPKPSAATIKSSSTIVIDYFQRAAPMTSDSSSPFNGDMALQDYQTVIIEMADIMCLNVLGKPNQNIINQFTADIALMKAWSLFRYSNDLNENVTTE